MNVSRETLERGIMKRILRNDTSKLILTLLSIYIGMLTPFVLVIAFFGYYEPLTRLIEGTFALTSIAVGFYYWKAKCENMHKFKQDNKINMRGDNNEM